MGKSEPGRKRKAASSPEVITIDEDQEEDIGQVSVRQRPSTSAPGVVEGQMAVQQEGHPDDPSPSLSLRLGHAGQIDWRESNFKISLSSALRGVGHFFQGFWSQRPLVLKFRISKNRWSHGHSSHGHFSHGHWSQVQYFQNRFSQNHFSQATSFPDTLFTDVISPGYIGPRSVSPNAISHTPYWPPNRIVTAQYKPILTRYACRRALAR